MVLIPITLCCDRASLSFGAVRPSSLPLELHRRRRIPFPSPNPSMTFMICPGMTTVTPSPARGFASVPVSLASLSMAIERVIAVPVLVFLVAAPSPVPLRELRAELARGQTAPSPAVARAVHHVRRETGMGEARAQPLVDAGWRGRSCAGAPRESRDRQRLRTSPRARASRRDGLSASLLAACQSGRS